MTAKPKRDMGGDLDQAKADDVVERWKIEGYDVYPFASWEDTHTSRGANIVRDGQHVTQVANLSAARGWIRQQAGKAPMTYEEAVERLTGVFGLPDLTLGTCCWTPSRVRAPGSAAARARTGSCPTSRPTGGPVTGGWPTATSSRRAEQMSVQHARAIARMPAWTVAGHANPELADWEGTVTPKRSRRARRQYSPHRIPLHDDSRRTKTYDRYQPFRRSRCAGI
jgi:hypothetical protein